MDEWRRGEEVGLIECQTCIKKIYVVKKFLGKFFLNFFSLNLIFSTILNYFCHFQPFLLFKKCAYLKGVISCNFDQCDTIFAQKDFLNMLHLHKLNVLWFCILFWYQFHSHPSWNNSPMTASYSMNSQLKWA